jgi:hypothetical protein
VKNGRTIGKLTTVSNVSIFILSLEIVWSTNIWARYDAGEYICAGLGVIFILLRFMASKNKFKKPGLLVIFFSIFMYFNIYGRYLDIRGMAIFFYRIFLLIFVMGMKEDERKKIILVTTVFYAWIVGIAMVLYVLILFCGIELPHSTITLDNYPLIKNYTFLVLYETPIMLNRFQAVYLEPGDLGTYAALLLFINKYQIRRKAVFVIFLSLLLSFSLGGYALLVAGYCIYQLIAQKKKYVFAVKLLMGTVLIGSIGFYLYTNFPEMKLTVLILSRLEYSEDKGFKGNNRRIPRFDYYYNNVYLKSSDALFGYGNDPEKIVKLFGDGMSSYKSYIVMFGVLGLFFIFLFYVSIVYTEQSILLWGLFLLYCISSYQHLYAYHDMELYLFIGATALFRTGGKHEFT